MRILPHRYSIGALVAAGLVGIGSCPSVERAQSNISAPCFIMPTPQKARYGDLIACPGWQWSAEQFSPTLRSAVEEACGRSKKGGLPLRFEISSDITHSQGYRLQVGQDGARVQAADDTGLYYALQSLRQLQLTREGERLVRAADVTDWPVFPIRGLITGRAWMERMAHWKMNLVQFPGARGDLDSQRRAQYRAFIEACTARYVHFLSHEGYKGYFGKKLEFTEAGYRDLVAYFDLRFDLGAREFTVAFDDMKLPEGKGGAWAGVHAEACLRVYRAMTARDPACRIFFCPVPYAGTPDTKLFASPLADGIDYLRTVGKHLPPDVLIYWTGTGVFSPVVDGHTTDKFASLIGRRPFFWDNDPLEWMKHLEPLHGRAPDLYAHVTGYVGNIAHPGGAPPAVLPVMLTIADYLWNPGAYDEAHALDRAFQSLAGSRWRELAAAWEAVRAWKAGRTPTVSSQQIARWQAMLQNLSQKEFAESFDNWLVSLRAAQPPPGSGQTTEGAAGNAGAARRSLR